MRNVVIRLSHVTHKLLIGRRGTGLHAPLREVIAARGNHDSIAIRVSTQKVPLEAALANTDARRANDGDGRAERHARQLFRRGAVFQLRCGGRESDRNRARRCGYPGCWWRVYKARLGGYFSRRGTTAHCARDREVARKSEDSDFGGYKQIGS